MNIYPSANAKIKKRHPELWRSLMPREIENPGGYALEHASTSIGCVLAAAKDGMGDDVSSGLAECMAAQLIRYRVPTWFRALS